MFFFVVLWFCFLGAFGAKFDGDKKVGSNGFFFAGKFCFTYHTNGVSAGAVSLDITNENNYTSGYQLVLYDDDQYNAYTDNDASCSEKIDNATASNVLPFYLNNKYTVTLAISDSVRPRFWWLYVANCDDQSKLGKLSFTSHFYQNNESSWSRELGYNEAGLNTMYLAHMIVYFILFTAQLYAYYRFRVSSYVHHLIKILTAVIGFQFVAVLFHFMDWMIYAETGYHQLPLEIFGGVFETLASSTFTLLLLLLAQGWTISRSNVIRPNVLLVGIGVMAVFQLAFFIWRLLAWDPETTQYFYNSVPMWWYGGLICIVGFIFVAQSYRSYRNEALQSKKHLYITLMVFFSTWFLMPLFRIVLADALDPWVRDIFVLSIEMVWDTLTFILMMGLMWPSRADKLFNLATKETQNRMLDSKSTSGKTAFEQLEGEMRTEQEMDDINEPQKAGQRSGNKLYNQLAEDRL